jgi:hypothetical protein
MVIPFALLSGAQALRDEILTPQVAEQYKLFRLVPNIDWKWYVAGLFVVVLIILFEGAYRAVRKREGKLGNMRTC